jgi:hypothetical protein
MTNISPSKILIIGLILMLTGAALPFLMVLRVLESTLLLNFIAFASQVAGLFMGTIGIVMFARVK